MEDGEYQNISYYLKRDIKETEKLNKLRALVLTYGFIIFTAVLIGIKPEKISIGILSGKIENPEYLVLSFSLIFFYYFITYVVVLLKEQGRFSFERGRSFFYRSLVVYKFKRHLINKVPRFEINEDALSGAKYIEGKYIIEINVNGNIPSDKLSGISETLDIPNTVSGDGRFQIMYTPAEQDEAFFEKNKYFGAIIKIHELLEYYIPLLFGTVVFMMSIHQIGLLFYYNRCSV